MRGRQWEEAIYGIEWDAWIKESGRAIRKDGRNAIQQAGNQSQHGVEGRGWAGYNRMKAMTAAVEFTREKPVKEMIGMIV